MLLALLSKVVWQTDEGDFAGPGLNACWGSITLGPYKQIYG